MFGCFSKLRIQFLVPLPWSFPSTCPFLGRSCCWVQSTEAFVEVHRPRPPGHSQSEAMAWVGGLSGAAFSVGGV